jgi:deoxyribonucleoside regulator
MANDRLADALMAARLYYFQDLTMDAIARELHTSRSTVSRLLSQARECGLVEVRLHDPREAGPQLERDISARFGVRTHVVHGTSTGSEPETLENVAKYAARVLNAFFGSDMILGLAWGTTISAVSRQLVSKVTRNSRIVQLNGAGNNQTTGIEYASEILRRFGAAYGAVVEQFPVPTFFDYADTKTALWRERSVRRVLDLQRRADVVMFGVGTFQGQTPSHVYRSGYLEPADLAALTRDGVVGDVATVFLRADGTYSDIAMNARSSGPDLAELARVDERVCVVSGLGRLEGLRGVLAAGLATQLIVDETTGAALIADQQEADPARTGAISDTRRHHRPEFAAARPAGTQFRVNQ